MTIIPLQQRLSSILAQWPYFILYGVLTVFLSFSLHSLFFGSSTPKTANPDPNSRLFSIAFSRKDAFDFFFLRANPGNPESSFDILQSGSKNTAILKIVDLFIPTLFPKQGISATGSLTIDNKNETYFKTQDLHFTNDHSIMIRSAGGSGMYDLGTNTYYKLQSRDPRLASVDQRQMRMVSADIVNGSYVLTIQSLLTGYLQSIAIADEISDVSPLLGQLNLPAQKIMRMSASSDRTVFVDHTVAPNLFLFTAGVSGAKALKVPFLSNKQIHFSPFFLTENIVLFGALDGNTWSTIEYNDATGQYREYSDGFSDAIYLSTLGKPILFQSVIRSERGEELNVPFGSFTLFTKKMLELKKDRPRQADFTKNLAIMRYDLENKEFRKIGEVSGLSYSASDGNIPVTESVVKAFEIPETYLRIFRKNLEKALESNSPYFLLDVY